MTYRQYKNSRATALSKLRAIELTLAEALYAYVKTGSATAAIVAIASPHFDCLFGAMLKKI